MKQYTFKDGTKVIASTAEEAKAQHKVMAAKRPAYKFVEHIAKLFGCKKGRAVDGIEGKYKEGDISFYYTGTYDKPTMTIVLYNYGKDNIPSIALDPIDLTGDYESKLTKQYITKLIDNRIKEELSYYPKAKSTKVKIPSALNNAVNIENDGDDYSVVFKDYGRIFEKENILNVEQAEKFINDNKDSLLEIKNQLDYASKLLKKLGFSISY